MTPMCNASGVQQGWAVGVADCADAVTIEYFNTSGVTQGTSLPAGWQPCVQGEAGPAWSPSYDAPVYAASIDIDFAAEEYVDISLTGSLTLTGSNYAQPAQIIVRIVCDGTARTLTFPSGWVFAGSAAPANILANKTGLLTLYSFGTVEADVVAVWEVQP